MKEPEWMFPCKAWEPVTRFWLYTVGTIIQVCPHRVLNPFYLQDLSPWAGLCVYDVSLEGLVRLETGNGSSKYKA